VSDCWLFFVYCTNKKGLFLFIAHCFLFVFCKVFSKSLVKVKKERTLLKERKEYCKEKKL